MNKDKEQLPCLIDDLIDADMVEVHANGYVATRIATKLDDLVNEVRVSNYKKIIVVLYDKNDNFDSIGLIRRNRVMEIVQEMIEMED